MKEDGNVMKRRSQKIGGWKGKKVSKRNGRREKEEGEMERPADYPIK